MIIINKVNRLITNFAYDAAGRLVKENNKVYQYSGLNKVTNILEDNKVISSYNYSISGQLASATTEESTKIIRKITNEFIDVLLFVCRNIFFQHDRSDQACN